MMMIKWNFISVRAVRVSEKFNEPHREKLLFGPFVRLLEMKSSKCLLKFHKLYLHETPRSFMFIKVSKPLLLSWITNQLWNSNSPEPFPQCTQHLMHPRRQPRWKFHPGENYHFMQSLCEAPLPKIQTPEIVHSPGSRNFHTPRRWWYRLVFPPVRHTRPTWHWNGLDDLTHLHRRHHPDILRCRILVHRHRRSHRVVGPCRCRWSNWDCSAANCAKIDLHADCHRHRRHHRGENLERCSIWNNIWTKKRIEMRTMISFVGKFCEVGQCNADFFLFRLILNRILLVW